MFDIQVPFLTVPALDFAAEQLVHNYSKWKGHLPRPPMPIDDIVENFLGLTLEIEDLRQRLGLHDVLGATWLEERIVRIDGSLEGNEGRFAFTLSHETGHWCLHGPLYETLKANLPLFAPDPATPARPAIVCRTSQRKASMEWQADQFAARLLMPTQFVREATQVAFGVPRVRIARLETRRLAGTGDVELREYAYRVIEAGSFTNVSIEAMCYRLLDLGLLIDADQPQMELL